MPPVNRIIILPDSPAVRALEKDKAFENVFLHKLQTKCTAYGVPLKKSDIEYIKSQLIEDEKEKNIPLEFSKKIAHMPKEYAESFIKMLNSVSDCLKEDQIKILQLMGDMIDQIAEKHNNLKFKKNTAPNNDTPAGR